MFKNTRSEDQSLEDLVGTKRPRSLNDIVKGLKNFAQSLFDKINQLETIQNETDEKILLRREIIQLMCHHGEIFTYLRDFKRTDDDPLSHHIDSLLNSIPNQNNAGNLLGRTNSLLNSMTGSRNALYHKYPYADHHRKKEIYLERVQLFQEKRENILQLIRLLEQWSSQDRKETNNNNNNEKTKKTTEQSFSQYQGESPSSIINHKDVLKNVEMIINEIDDLFSYNSRLLRDHPFAVENFLCNIAQGLKVLNKWRFQEGLPHKNEINNLFRKNQEAKNFGSKIIEHRRDIAHNF